MAEQLALQVAFREDATFENFLGNALTVSALKQMVRNQGEQFIFLYGPNQSGKSHLLQAMCHFAHGMSMKAFYLSFKDDALQPEVLQGLEDYDLIVLDDIDNIAGEASWEEALFHLYNRLRDSRARLIVAASDLPNKIGIQLPDLLSRLNFGLTLAIEMLDDDQKMNLLIARAGDRGLSLPESAVSYLLTHYSRQTKDLLSAFEKLDQASMQQQRKLTIPFIKQILKLGE